MQPEPPEHAAVPLLARPAVAVATLVLATLLLTGLRIVSLPLMDPDESRCALIVQDVLHNGHWTVPQLEGKPYVDKPPPYFWIVAVTQKAVGNFVLAGRLISALATLLAVLVTWDMARRLAGPLAGLIAGLTLLTGVEFIFLARWYRMEMPFAAFMWAAIWWFWRWEDRGPAAPGPQRPRRPLGLWQQWAGFYGLAAMAVLVKGPAALALICAIVGCYMLVQRRPLRVLEFLNPVGLAILLAIVLPPALLIARDDPGFLGHFFFVENVERFASGGHGHRLNFLFYIPILLGGLWPWTIYLPGGLMRTAPWRQEDRRLGRSMWLVWLAAAIPLILFSISTTKLMHYILPCFPPLAVLMAPPMAAWIAGRRPDRLYLHGARAMAGALVVSMAILGWCQHYFGRLDAVYFSAAAVLILAALAMLWLLARGRRGRFAALAFGCMLLLEVFALGWVAPMVYEQISRRDMGLLAKRIATPDTALAFAGSRRYSFPLYAGRIAFTNPDATNPEELPDLVALFKGDRPVLCLVASDAQMRRLAEAMGDSLIYTVASGPQEFRLITNHAEFAEQPGPQ
ncbi:MAG: Undecaprenyl phosphate-alpha-4-amino-4-deoxy-L-arabinose arabinosyl transferase [Phycisphaerae bacterium]|nr:Undecaprenyl phosphate-alpha-4-amino-4-deoxy-L-arabinose arabinosyl transferase [Phycisphaerae bacterium]